MQLHVTGIDAWGGAIPGHSACIYMVTQFRSSHGISDFRWDKEYPIIPYGAAGLKIHILWQSVLVSE